jgi:hypothetical protein
VRIRAGRLIGFNDLLSSFTAAGLPLAGLAAGLSVFAAAWVAGNAAALLPSAPADAQVRPFSV